MAPVSTGSSSYYPTSTAFLTEAVYAGAAMTDDLRPSPVPSVIHHTPAASDPGLHQFIIYMISPGGCLPSWCGAPNVDDDDEEVQYACLPITVLSHVDKQKYIPAGDAFRPPMITLPQPSATFNRSDPWLSHRQMDRYISVKRICSPVAGASLDEQYALTLLARFLQSVDIRLGTS
ncbi:hypothetical protein B0H14DRAFT_2707134 [Mycena olivaceomarginata]|nr:hypothetical protein B0H14DRAFT_2707134 [Mycena olivaceomarginata]